jgi:hypothetical protein
LKYIPKKEGVRGTFPWAASPSGGERGVILQAAAENKRIETIEDFYRTKKSIIRKKTLTSSTYLIHRINTYNYGSVPGAGAIINSRGNSPAEKGSARDYSCA